MNPFEGALGITLSQRDGEAKKPAWTDDDDRHKKFKVIAPTPKTSKYSDDSDSDQELTIQDKNLIKRSLPRNELLFKQVAPANYQRTTRVPVHQVQFHPLRPLSMICLDDGTIELFEVDGEKNTFLQRVKIENSRKPFTSIKPDGTSIVICCPRHRGLVYVYDIASEKISKNLTSVGRQSIIVNDVTISPDSKMIACRGHGPEVNVVDAKTFENLHSIRLNQDTIATSFISCNELVTLGKSGTAYVWDLRNHTQCKHKFNDFACVESTSMVVSTESQLIALGSNVGVVNLFGLADCMSQKNPQPIKAMTNLTTPITTLKFGHDGEMLLVGSNHNANQVRIYNTTSRVIYKNFPRAGKNYKTINDADFSPNGKYLALGCSTGRVPLVRLLQYSEY